MTLRPDSTLSLVSPSISDVCRQVASVIMASGNGSNFDVILRRFCLKNNFGVGWVEERRPGGASRTVTQHFQGFVGFHDLPLRGSCYNSTYKFSETSSIGTNLSIKIYTSSKFMTVWMNSNKSFQACFNHPWLNSNHSKSVAKLSLSAWNSDSIL